MSRRLLCGTNASASAAWAGLAGVTACCGQQAGCSETEECRQRGVARGAMGAARACLLRYKPRCSGQGRGIDAGGRPPGQPEGDRRAAELEGAHLGSPRASRKLPDRSRAWPPGSPAVAASQSSWGIALLFGGLRRQPSIRPRSSSSQLCSCNRGCLHRSSGSPPFSQGAGAGDPDQPRGAASRSGMETEGGRRRCGSARSPPGCPRGSFPRT